MREITINNHEMKALYEDSMLRFEEYSKWKTRPKFIFEGLYEYLRELASIVLMSKGFSSDSHEETIKFLCDEKIIDKEIFYVFDYFKKLRNKCKYYGKNISKERLEEAIPELFKIKEVLNEAINLD